jgi:predicted ATPase
MNVDAGVDYRLRTLTQAHLWLSPLNAETTRRWINSGWRWRGQNASTPGAGD